MYRLDKRARLERNEDEDQNCVASQAAEILSLRLMRLDSATAPMMRREWRARRSKSRGWRGNKGAGRVHWAGQRRRECRTRIGKPSASIASRSRGFLSSDWARGHRLWLLEWLWSDRDRTDAPEAN